jgi:hypothetical protein
MSNVYGSSRIYCFGRRYTAKTLSEASVETSRSALSYANPAILHTYAQCLDCTLSGV